MAGYAPVCHTRQYSLFTCNPDSYQILIDASSSLLGWLHPQLPEDLWIVRLDGSVILGTIAHEEDAWLDIGDDEVPLFKEVLLAL